MPKVKVKKNVCGDCGVDIREGTVFCYNCGSRVAGDDAAAETNLNGGDKGVDAETQAALDDLAERLKIEDAPDDGQLARAAAQRRKARVTSRKPKEFTWEPADDSSDRIVFLPALLIAVIAAAVVAVTVLWK